MVNELSSFLGGERVEPEVHSIIRLLEGTGGTPSPSIIEGLRRSPDPDVSSAVPILLDLAQGTMRAIRLGKAPDGWLFTNKMAEQATHPLIAGYHAKRYTNRHHVLEICTGSGLDTAALAGVAHRVTSYEADPLTHVMAARNLSRSGISNVRLINQEWPTGDLQAQHDAVWADPSRRVDDVRVRSAALYNPPLESIPTAELVGVKVGPGDEVDASGFASEYIGYGKECRERILWRQEGIGLDLRVTLVDKGLTWCATSATPPQILPKADFLIEPHNALIASGAVGQFLAEIGSGVFDRRIAYGAMTAEPPTSGWYTRYRVKAIETGVSVRKIQTVIREYRWGPTTIFKKRGWDNNPEDLRKTLSFSEDGPPGVVIVMRVGTSHQTVYAERMDSAPGSK